MTPRTTKRLELGSRLLIVLSLILGVVGVHVMRTGLGAAAVHGEVGRIVFGLIVYVAGALLAIAVALMVVVGGWRPFPFRFNWGLASWSVVGLYAFSIVWYFTVVV